MSEKQQQEEVRAAALNAVAQIEEAGSPQPETAPSLTKPRQPEQPMELAECPRCGHNLENREVLKPTEEETRQYFRCLMSGKVFKKNYQLFNGDLTATYSLLTGDESEVLSSALKQIDEDDFVTHASKAVRIKLMFYMRRWGDHEFKPPETSDIEELWAMWKERFGDKGEDMPVLMIKVMLQFNQLSEMLPMSGLDENFYKGAGLS